MQPFRNTLGRDVFYQKYAHGSNDSWEQLAHRVVQDVCGRTGWNQPQLLNNEELINLEHIIAKMQFIPGGRYLYYAGRGLHAWNNCFVFIAQEDTREEWARIAHAHMACLAMGGGVGTDYSIFRAAGRMLKRTGGVASGPINLMEICNEIGRGVMQGGSRRSALYASLAREHPDIMTFLHRKDWDKINLAGTGITVADMKRNDFNFPAPLDMTNISVNYGDEWLRKKDRANDEVFLENCRQALHTGEPGFSFNFGDKSNETGRNACCEVVSSDSDDVCNLGSVNLSRINSIDELALVVYLASKFLVCGTMRADLPYERIYQVREKNRRLGLGLMGVHEWLLKRGYPYEVVPELHTWLGVWQKQSEKAANAICDRFYLNRPVAYRAIAPTGTIGMIAGTTTGIEPLFAVAYKRRMLKNGTTWIYQLAVDGTAQALIDNGINPDSITETAHSLVHTPEKRIKFQADMQHYVDNAISSTINLPNWNEYGSDKYVLSFAHMLAKYAPNLRGFTCYPDGARGGQPLTPVDYRDAIAQKGITYEENSEVACRNGVCGI